MNKKHELKWYEVFSKNDNEGWGKETDLLCKKLLKTGHPLRLFQAGGTRSFATLGTKESIENTLMSTSSSDYGFRELELDQLKMYQWVSPISFLFGK